MKKFKEYIEIANIESKSLLCLDVCIRWNSAYLVLDGAKKIEKAFERFEEHDRNFRIELELGEGLPTEDNWKTVRSLG